MATALFAASRQNAKITGVVKFSDGKPAEGAVVLVDGLVLMTRAGKDGKYELKDIPWGITTFVALHRGYKPAYRMNIDVKRGARLKGIDFVLEKDPGYVPDAIKLDDMQPPPDSILAPNTKVEIKGVIRYRLKNDRTARVVLAFQDDRKNYLLPSQPRYDIKQGSSFFEFRHTIQTPARFGNADIFVAAALIPGQGLDVGSTDVVSYQVRSFHDDLRFSSVGMSRDDVNPSSMRFAATIDYVLETVDKGVVIVRVMGDSGRGDYDQTMFETSLPVDKAQSDRGSLKFGGRFILPSRAKNVKLRIDLVPAGEKDPKLIKWSKPYADVEEKTNKLTR